MFLATCKMHIKPTSLVQDFNDYSKILMDSGYDDQEIKDFFKQEYENDRLLAYNVSLFDQAKTIEFTFIWETEQMHTDFTALFLTNKVMPIIIGVNDIEVLWETQEI
jgi:hypothetical protein